MPAAHDTRRPRFLRFLNAIALTTCVALLTASVALAHRCTGDCDGSDTVSVAELVVGVRIALEQTPLFTCVSYDADFDHRVSIDELLVAVNNAFTFCGHGVPTATSSGASAETPPPSE